MAISERGFVTLTTDLKGKCQLGCRTDLGKFPSQHVCSAYKYASPCCALVTVLSAVAKGCARTHDYAFLELS